MPQKKYDWVLVMLGSPIERVCVFWSNVFWGASKGGAGCECGGGGSGEHAASWGEPDVPIVPRCAFTAAEAFLFGGVFILGETRLSFIVLLA